MKIFNFIFALAFVSACASLSAKEADSDHENIYYVGYELATPYSTGISVGMRHLVDSYIFDANVTGEHKKGTLVTKKFMKIGVNAYKEIKQGDSWQLYTGIGFDVTWQKSGVFKSNGIFPLISLGTNFDVGLGKKVFVEVAYKPFCFHDNRNEEIHSTALRMGFSL